MSKEITRKEAIEELKLIRANFNYRINGTSNFDKALKYAIASLETDEAYQLEYERTTKNDLGVDTDKLIADCEKMSFDFELFGRPTKALLLDAVKNIVKKLPSVTPQEPRWIPVSERLPEDSGEYLVSVIDKEDEDYKQVGVAWFAHKKDYAISKSEWRELEIDETVIAWMPLPKAYREVEE